MTTLTPEQRNYYYLLEVERTGIHKPILAALYATQGQPSVGCQETGLGISPANQIPLEAVDTFAKQVYYAANTVRSLIVQLAAKGWIGSELWNSEKGCYTDLLIKTIAAGYIPPDNEPTAARLETCDASALLKAYLQDLETDLADTALPQNLEYLVPSLLVFIETILYFYYGLPHQRDAMIDAVRIWCRVDTREAAITCLEKGQRDRGTGGQGEERFSSQSPTNNLDESRLDIPLKQFFQSIGQTWAEYPYQIEALIRLIQLWRQSPSREAAIASLEKNTSSDVGLSILDSALFSFIQRLPQSYISSGSQRYALTETFRLWHRFNSRTTALEALGISADSLTSSVKDRTQLVRVAIQLDRELGEFIRRLPAEYKGLDNQREALINLVQLWRSLTTRNQTIQSLFDDLKRMKASRRDVSEAPPVPMPLAFPQQPNQWSTQNICLDASIVADSSFTWAEATQGGLWMPPNQETVDAIVRIASLAQKARDRTARPFLVTVWYLPLNIYQAFGGIINSRHILGDAMSFTCEGLSGSQLYWFLDPWWPGGLSRHTQFPHLCHIDARSYRARWEY